MSLSVPAAFS